MQTDDDTENGLEERIMIKSLDDKVAKAGSNYSKFAGRSRK